MTVHKSTFGSPLLRNPNLSWLEKAYIKTFSVPVLGLSIRAKLSCRFPAARVRERSKED